MLDEVYGSFVREQANASALRKVMEEKQEGKPMEKWIEWTSTHLSFFKKEGLQKMPDDVRQAYEQGVFDLQPERTNNAWGRVARREKDNDKTPRRRSRSPHGKHWKDDGMPVDEDEPAAKAEVSPTPMEVAETKGEDQATPGANCQKFFTRVVTGPYLEPEEADGKYKILAVQGQYEMSIEIDESRRQFQTATGKEILPPTEAKLPNQGRCKLLEQYILAIHQNKDVWDRFPDLDDYYLAVESKYEVEVDPEDDDDE